MEQISLKELFETIMKNSKVTSFVEYKEINKYKDRVIYLEDVDEESCKEIFNLILEYNKQDSEISIENRKPIQLFINSCGGNMTDAYALIDTILMSKTPVHTVGVGVCYSAGGLILIAGHKRFMYPLGSFMFHEGSAGVFGDAGKVKDTMRFYETQLTQMKKFIMERTKIDHELYEQKLANDWYLTADECLKYGIIDQISTTLF